MGVEDDREQDAVVLVVRIGGGDEDGLAGKAARLRPGAARALVEVGLDDLLDPPRLAGIRGSSIASISRSCSISPLPGETRKRRSSALGIGLPARSRSM